MARPSKQNLADRASRDRATRRQDIMQSVLTGFTVAELHRLQVKVADRLRQLRPEDAIPLSELLTEDQVRDLLRAKVAKSSTVAVAAASDNWPSGIWAMTNDRAGLNPAVLAYLGYERVIRYRLVQRAEVEQT